MESKLRYKDLKKKVAPSWKAKVVARTLVSSVYQSARILHEGDKEKTLLNCGLLYIIHINYNKLITDRLFKHHGIAALIERLVKQLPKSQRIASKMLIDERDVPLSHFCNNLELQHMKVDKAYIKEVEHNVFTVPYGSHTDLTYSDIKTYDFLAIMELSKRIALELGVRIENILLEMGEEELGITLPRAKYDKTKQIEPQDRCEAPMAKNPIK